jgi:nitrate reductase delta subunit
MMEAVIEATKLHELLAELVKYPEAGYHEHVEECRRALAEAHPAVAPLLDTFAQAIAPLSVEDLQELFTRTFDLNPVCSLEIGWHLFGENYDRGALLVKMRQELRRYGLAESAELPDHFTHALLLLGHMEPERAQEFAVACVLPALEKMLAAFAGKAEGKESISAAALAPATTPYLNVMQAICRVLNGLYAERISEGAFHD